MTALYNSLNVLYIFNILKYVIDFNVAVVSVVLISC